MPIIVFSGSKTIHLLHLLSFLSFVLSQSPENMPFYCPHSPNNTASEKFTFNLQSFLRIISDAAGTRAYYKTTTGGNYPNKVYGLYLCRGDVNNELCHKCVDLATDTIQNDCDGTKEAIIWSDECMVRYSDRSFSSNFETSPNNCSTNRENVTEPEKMRKIVSKSLDEVITREIFNNEYKYATHVVNFSGNHRLYSLVQCIPELSMEECRACLMSAAASILRCYRDKQGARFLNPSCCIRFELYPFFSEREAQTSSPDAGNAERGRKESRMRIEIGTLVSAVIIIVGLISCFLWRMRRCEKDEEGKVISQEVQLLELGESQIGSDHSFILQEVKLVESKEFPMFPFDLTLEATQHFSEENKLGEGGFGPVYKGILADGKEIAVKRLSSTSGQGIEEFKNEVTLIAKLQHKNLVRLLGCCSGGNELLLIYEYMPNKSLDFLLFDSTRSVQLDWKRRVGIINGITRGLLYLHEDSRLKIIHRDLKTSNILLDHEMNPKISDFGMARIFEGNQNEVNTIRVVGTYGYMAPEYAMGGQFSVKSDVFSFGVIVLEIISGKKNSGFYLSGQSRSLLTYAWKLWCEGNAMELVDPLVKQSYNPDELLKCIHIGLLCVQDDPADRPIMSSVVVMLASDRMTPPQPTQPAFFVGRNAAKSSQQLDTKVCSVNEVTLSIVSPR